MLEDRWDEAWELIVRLNNQQAATGTTEDIHSLWKAFEKGENPCGLRSTIYASWLRSRAKNIDA